MHLNFIPADSGRYLGFADNELEKKDEGDGEMSMNNAILYFILLTVVGFSILSFLVYILWYLCFSEAGIKL